MADAAEHSGNSSPDLNLGDMAFLEENNDEFFGEGLRDNFYVSGIDFNRIAGRQVFELGDELVGKLPAW